ncbi:MAG: AAA family ATPase, partial [Huintestinicola sp.]
MLSELYIKNLAIIEEASIPFSDNFNVFTGETGAGKSILINGINAVLGQRITKDIVRAGCDKAVISALFTELSDNVCRRLDELGVSHEDGQLMLTREISSDGGSIARVNSRASTVSVLREIGECLVNIHGQHDNQILMDPDKHLSILDSYGGLEKQTEEYHESFRQLQDISRKLKKLTLERKEKTEREEMLRERIEEIGSLSIEENEDETLEAEYKIARNSEDICAALNEAHSFLNGVDDSDIPGAAELVSNACGDVSAFSETLPSLKALSDRLENVRVELEDIVSEISSELDKIDIDAERYAFLTDRLNDLNRIKKKYGPELSDVLECYNNAAEELDEFES